MVVSRECGGGFEFLAGHRMADVDPTFGMQWNITRGQCSSMCDNIQVKKDHLSDEFELIETCEYSNISDLDRMSRKPLGLVAAATNGLQLA